MFEKGSLARYAEQGGRGTISKVREANFSSSVVMSVEITLRFRRTKCYESPGAVFTAAVMCAGAA
jgi:hypothetical protein